MAIKFMFERMALRWVLDHQFVFLKALLFVMMDLTGEVSSGALDMAKANLEQMVRHCAKPITPDDSNEEVISAQKKSLYDVIHELVRLVTSPNTLVREQVSTASGHSRKFPYPGHPSDQMWIFPCAGCAFSESAGGNHG